MDKNKKFLKKHSKIFLAIEIFLFLYVIILPFLVETPEVTLIFYWIIIVALMVTQILVIVYLAAKRYSWKPFVTPTSYIIRGIIFSAVGLVAQDPDSVITCGGVFSFILICICAYFIWES